MTTHSTSIRHYGETLVRYRDLIWQMVKREFGLRYRGSVLGFFWAFATPLLQVAVFTFIFAVIFPSRWGSDVITTADYAAIFLAGMMVHGLFAESMSRAPALVVSQPSYVKRVVFPLEILPVVTVLTALFNALIGIAIVVLFNFILRGQLQPTLLYLPVVFAPYLLLMVGVVLFVSSIGVYIRDLGQLIGLIVTLSLFITPVFYPISAVPEPYRAVMYLNPLTYIVEQTRAVVLFGVMPDWAGLALYTLASAAVLALGYAWFQRSRNGFADVI